MEYLAIGIQEYWIVDRFKRSMTVHANTREKRDCIVIHEGETYTTNLLPGFELPLNELLASADKWDNEE